MNLSKWSPSSPKATSVWWVDGPDTHRNPLERLDPMPASDTAVGSLDCGYRNATDRMVIVRCCGPEAFYLERVVFPFELLTFRCPSSSRVEIWTHGIGGPELMETLETDSLQVLTPVDGGETGYGDSPWLQAG